MLFSRVDFLGEILVGYSFDLQQRICWIKITATAGTLVYARRRIPGKDDQIGAFLCDRTPFTRTVASHA